MKIARFMHNGEPTYGVVEGSDLLPLTEHPIYSQGQLQTTGEVLSAVDAKLLAPVIPSKIVAVGKNFVEHAAEMGGEVPAEPLLFLKPSTTIVGPEDPIRLPAISSEVHYEAELAVVIGTVLKDVTPEQANEGIFGYTCANDVTARDFQRSDNQWTRAKGFDTFCPLGPWIETDLDITDIAISCEVRDEERQYATVAEMVRKPADLVAYISSIMTLLPGDVVLTGTPAGVGPLASGDVVMVSIEGIGTLANPVI